VNEQGGGSISEGRPAQDPLFRKLMAWSWGVFGTAFMGMQVWLVSNVADIKAALPRMADKDAQIDAHLATTDHRVDKLEDGQEYLRGKIYQYEGRTMRGAAQDQANGK
jgi:hypothetical protein